LKSGTTSSNPSSSGGVTGSAPGWPTDEKIEALRAAWFAATDEAQRRDLGD
jgi:peptide/nickel transport system substrate-binding protein